MKIMVMKLGKIVQCNTPFSAKNKFNSVIFENVNHFTFDVKFNKNGFCLNTCLEQQQKLVFLYWVEW